MGGDVILKLHLCAWLALGGASFGHFADCAVWRWARGERMMRGQRRQYRCRKEKRSAECVWAKIAGAVTFLCFGARFGPSLALLQWLIFGALLLAVSLADMAKLIIPDSLLLALAANRALCVVVLSEPPLHVGKSVLLGLCAGPLPLLVLTLFMELQLGREMMGGGDIKLLAALALYLEWPQIVLTLLGGCLLGLFSAAAMKKGRAFAFGPCLAAASAMMVCFGDPLVQWFLRGL